MKNKIRNGDYTEFNQELFNFNKINPDKYELIDRNSRYENLKEFGFIKYNSSISCLEVDRDKIVNACRISIYCKYKGFKFFVENFFDEKYILRPLEEAQTYFKDVERQGYDPVYEVEESKITDIWEERTPIEGFKFDVEPIYYIKKDGKFL